MAKFAFSALFSAVAVAAAFDDACATDAANGRVNKAFAMLADAEYGLPLLTPKGQPIAKAAFLKLADGYRAANGKGHGIKGRNKLAAWGTALDAIALGLRAGAEPGADKVAELTGAGLYRDAEAWAAATAPRVRSAEELAAAEALKAATAAAKAAPVADDEAIGLESAGGADGAPQGLAELDADTLLDTVILALSTGAFTPGELTRLGAAVAEALGAAADISEEVAGIAHALQSAHVAQSALAVQH